MRLGKVCVLVSLSIGLFFTSPGLSNQGELCSCMRVIGHFLLQNEMLLYGILALFLDCSRLSFLIHYFFL